MHLYIYVLALGFGITRHFTAPGRFVNCIASLAVLTNCAGPNTMWENKSTTPSPNLSPVKALSLWSFTKR